MPVANGLFKALILEGGDAQQAQAGDFLRVGLQGFISQRLDLVAPFFIVGKVLRLCPLAQQLGLTTGQVGRALEHPGRLRRTVLRHIGTAQKVQAFSRIRLCCSGTLKARDHFFKGLRRLGEFAGQFDLVAGTKMQVQAQAQYRHQHCRQQRNGLAQAGHTPRCHAFGVREQFAGRFGAAGFELFGGQHALFALGLQLGHPLLVQGNVQSGTVFFALGTAPAQNRDQ